MQVHIVKPLCDLPVPEDFDHGLKYLEKGAVVKGSRHVLPRCETRLQNKGGLHRGLIPKYVLGYGAPRKMQEGELSHLPRPALSRQEALQQAQIPHDNQVTDILKSAPQ